MLFVRKKKVNPAEHGYRPASEKLAERKGDCLVPQKWDLENFKEFSSGIKSGSIMTLAFNPSIWYAEAGGFSKSSRSAWSTN